MLGVFGNVVRFGVMSVGDTFKMQDGVGGGAATYSYILVNSLVQRGPIFFTRVHIIIPKRFRKYNKYL